MAHEPHDAAADRLGHLVLLAPDADRSARLRTRCRTRLQRKRGRTLPVSTRAALARRLLAPVIVGAICVLYAIALVVTTLRLEGGLR